MHDTVTIPMEMAIEIADFVGRVETLWSDMYPVSIPPTQAQINTAFMLAGFARGSAVAFKNHMNVSVEGAADPRQTDEEGNQHQPQDGETQ